MRVVEPARLVHFLQVTAAHQDLRVGLHRHRQKRRVVRVGRERRDVGAQAELSCGA